MRPIRLLLPIMLLAIFTTSCTVDTVYQDDNTVNLNQLLTSYDLWYVNINQTKGNGEVPFLQIAFTISFKGGVLYANNNLVGIGSTGNGLGIDVGYYDAYDDGVVEIDHDIDGVYDFEVYQNGNNTIELYDRNSQTSYFLTGYQRNSFDYDYVFYDNIHYFLQEYEAWEKVYTSDYGAINDFDDENYLRFLPDGNGDTFQSSIDARGTSVNNLYWDYEGNYKVYDVSGDPYTKTLTLDYDYLGNDYFEITVIDDETIELYHPDSGTVYRFKGRGYISYMKGETQAKGVQTTAPRKRVKRTNETMNITRKSERKKINIS
ncbi:nicotinic acid mononucleotide adenyltransferase [Zhouia sp. PK063]|uniref:nicotinic acid mononucleotide adenyltransferase n=1 Tax=Zhouia sp. PK063 TaxID=3373602 RepID=UPI00379B93D3